MKRTIVLVFAVLLSLCLRVAAQEATVRPGDSFDLRISGVPSDDQANISTNYTVDGQGFFNISYIGKMKVAGRTAGEIQSLVERSYMDQGIFTHPTVTLTIAAAARFVNVGGQVKSPGRIAYSADMTLFSAINAAGDFTEFGDQGKVRLMRGSHVDVINCKKIRANPALDVKVLPGDIIQVPETIF